MSDPPKPKVVVLIGNGLGRSFDNKGFATDSILKTLFEEPQGLSSEAKDFFYSLYHNTYPKNESELGSLEEVFEAFKLIEKFRLRLFFCNSKEKEDVFIDNEFKKKFEDYYKELRIKFLKKIEESSSRVIRDKNQNGYTYFTENFLKFVSLNRPTIATLNYDILLYNAFFEDGEFERNVLREKNGYTDGFKKIKETKNLPKFEEDFFGLTEKRTPYLHLHGAFFYTQKDDEAIEKQSKSYKPKASDNPLVILTSQKKKIQKVYSSPKDFLHIYSSYFFEKLCEAKHLIIFGYGGGDEYLNSILRYSTLKACKRREKLLITIIERKCDEISDNELESHWSKCLTDSIYEIQTCSNYAIPLSKQTYPYEIRRLFPLHQFSWNF